MKYLLFIFFTAVALSQTYDVGQTNANVAAALANALSYPDSNYLKTSELGSIVQAYDADLADLADGTLTASKVAGVANADYGDVTVSSGSWSVEDDSHNHVIANVDGLQTALDGKSATSHTHTEFFDTLSFNVNIADTVITGDNAIWKIPNNITITEVAAFTNTGTVTFNIEERGETTPNTAGTDVMTSDLAADTDQQETGTFSNAGIARDAWLALSITSKTGDPTLFGVSIRYVKTN